MGWETKEEASLPASEAGRPDGSNSAPSENARSGSAAAGSDVKRVWIPTLIIDKGSPEQKRTE